MTASVAIVDYGMGNLRSVANAVVAAGGTPAVVDDPDALGDPSHVIVPGVGAFTDGIANLGARGWIVALRSLAAAGDVRLLGICLGMQLFATRGTEHGDHEGIGLLPGVAKQLDRTDETIRIPHIGWNDVAIAPESVLFAGIDEPATFYFLHSYALGDDVEGVTATCTYGSTFAAAVEHGNVYGVQFHPEKSQRRGLRLLENFLAT